MTSQERAELLFKRKQELLVDSQRATSEYEQHARAEHEKTVRLRALRLARDAELPTNQKKRRRNIIETSARS